MSPPSPSSPHPLESLYFSWLRTGPQGQPDWELPETGVVWLLNFTGEASLTWKDGTRRALRPGSMCCLRPASGRGLAYAGRHPGTEHECLVLHFPEVWLKENLATMRPDLPSDFRVVLLGPVPLIPLVSRPLEPVDKVWAQGLLAPHLCEAARALLTPAKMTDFLLQKVFTPPPAGRELFCTRTKWLAMERVAKVKTALLAALDEPPPLEALAQLAGVNPHHLSRTFTQVEGITLTAWLRRQRIERAAHLIATGRCNVSEAAVEVGYQSLSHFSRAFLEAKGVAPSRWSSHVEKQSWAKWCRGPADRIKRDHCSPVAPDWWWLAVCSRRPQTRGKLRHCRHSNGPFRSVMVAFRSFPPAWLVLSLANPI